MQGLRAGALGKEIEARLRGVTEPSVEKLKEALREEIDKLEERFHVRKRKDNADERLEDRTMVEPGGDPGGTPKPAEAPDGGGPGGREGICVPEVHCKSDSFEKYLNQLYSTDQIAMVWFCENHH